MEKRWRTGVSNPNVSISIQEYSQEVVDQWIREIGDVAPHEIKIKMSQDSSNGDHFVHSLHKINNILHQLTVRLWRGETPLEDEDSVISNAQLQVALRHLASDTVPNLIMYMGKISTNTEEMSRHLLDVLSYLVALDPSCPSSFPTLFASCLLHVCKHWPEAVELIMKHLCHYTLPMTVLFPDELKGPVDMLSISPTLMLVFDSSYCQTRHHIMVTGTLMRIKRNVCTDLLSVIAYGPPDGQTNALKLLLHYWPLDFHDYYPTDPYVTQESSLSECEFSNCSNSAEFLCLDGSCAIQVSKKFSEDGRKKMFMVLCTECNDRVHRTMSVNHRLVRMPKELRDVKPNCELRRECAGQETASRAEVTCFGESCTAIQNGQPVRMCMDCHSKQHADLQDPSHIYQVGPQNPWTCQDPIATSVLLEAIAKLLSQIPTKCERKESRRTSVHAPGHRISISIGSAREGFLLLDQYFRPDEPVEEIRHRQWLERLVALVLEWLRVAHDLLEGIMEEGLVIPGVEPETHGRSFHEGSFLVNYQKTVEGACSNHRELHTLVVKHAIPWLKSVCLSGNTQCITNALCPNTLGHVQVGEMWRYTHEPIERYRRTLSILVLLVKNPLLTDTATNEIYNDLMSEWMEVLVELRNQPGQMEKLKDLLIGIFTFSGEVSHTKKVTRFEFIRQNFRQKNPTLKQRALFWLQDLSRLKVPVPYTSHIFDDIFQKKTRHIKPSSTSTSENVSVEPAMPLLRRESTGSMSGNESESPLVTQSSVDLSNTIELLHLNFPLPRYIIMLDIWYSQLTLQSEGVPLEFEAFQRYACYMLDRDWCSHSYQDHNDASNMCLLCQATALWFNLATHIIQHYSQASQQEEEGEETLDGEQGTPITKKGRVSIKLPGPTKKKRSSETAGNNGSTHTPVQTDHTPFEDSWEIVGVEEVTEKKAVPLKSGKPSPRGRRPAMIQRHSELDLSAVSSPTSKLEMTNEPHLLPKLYSLFQLSVEKLHPSSHPDSMIQIITFLNILVIERHVLKGIDKPTLLSDVHNLFKKLWNILESDVSFLSQMCVSLLLACQEDIVLYEVSSADSPSSLKLWKCISDGFATQRWKITLKTVDKLALILHFMPGGMEGMTLNNWKPHKYIKLTLAYGFCQMVRLIQSKDSMVITRVQYCLGNLRKKSIEAIKSFLLVLFIHGPLYQSTIIQSLALLNSALPKLSFLSLSLIQQLLAAADGLMRSRDMDDVLQYVNTVTEAQKKTSQSSLLSGRSTVIRPSLTSSAYSYATIDEDTVSPEILQLQCDTLSLLLKYISNTKSDFRDTTVPTRSHGKRSTFKGPQEETPAENLVTQLETLVCRKFHIPPQELRRKRVFETFIIHSYKMLDKNVEFCETKSMIPFVLRVLGYSVSPTRGDYPFAYPTQIITSPTTPTPKYHLNYTCSYTLGNLPSHLQAPWLRVLFIVLYKYTHIILQYQDAVSYLMWCIEIILCTLRSSPHVCPAPQFLPPPQIHPRLSKHGPTSSIPSSPGSPPPESAIFSNPLESPGRIRSQPLERILLETVPEESGSFNKSLQESVDMTTPHSRPPFVHTSSVASYSSSISVDPTSSYNGPRSGVCVICHAPTDVFSEEVVALSITCLGTCAHHTPELVSAHLVTWMIPCIAKVVISGHYYWQDSSISDPPPGSGMSVAKQFLLSLLTQFAERRVFLYLLRHDHIDLTETVFKAVASCLANQLNEEEEDRENEDLTQASLVEYFLEDAVNSTNFTQVVNSNSFNNLACYLEVIPEGSAHLFLRLNHLDTFLKKLQLEENRNILYKQNVFENFLRIIIQLLKFCDPFHAPSTGQTSSSSSALSITVSSILQEFPVILTEALQCISCPTGGLVTLVGVWYRAFLQHGHKRQLPKKYILLKLLIDQFTFGLSVQSSILPENIISITQTFLLFLNEYVYFGYIDTLSEQRIYSPFLKEQEVYLGSLVNSGQDTTGIEHAFTGSMSDALRYLACMQPQASIEVAIQVKLVISQLIALRIHRQHQPLGLVRRILEGEYSFAWMEKSPKSSNPKSKSVNMFIGDHISSLQVLGWLLMGAMCHNAVHSAVERTSIGKIEGVISNECEVLTRLGHSLSETVDDVYDHVKGSLNFLVKKSGIAYWGLRCILCFCSIWTTYMELHVADSQAIPEVAHFWQRVVDQILALPSKEGMLLCIEDIVVSVCEQTIIPLKKARLSCVPLLLPTWKRVINKLQDPQEVPDYNAVTEVSMDTWYREMLRNFIELESKIAL